LKGDHRVSLSQPVIELLQNLPTFSGTDLVFSDTKGKPLSDMTLTAAMRRMKVEATPHGFRASFATWAQERTLYPSDVRGHALAHAVGSKTTGAYEGSDQFERRISLMKDWAAFIHATPVLPTYVVGLRSAA
jgi:integrase